MRRVIRDAGTAGATRAITAPGLLEDPAIRAAVEAEGQRAYARGLADGEARGRAEAEATGSALAASIAQAVQIARTQSDRIADDLAGRVNVIALAAANAIVGEVDQAAEGVLHRVTAALRVIDDRPVTVDVNPADAETVAAVASAEIEVRSAPDLLPGEARVTGRFADADLTWNAVWTSVKEALDVE